MVGGGAVKAESHAGRCPLVVGGGQEVGRGVGRAHAAGEEKRKQGKGRGRSGGGDHFKSARRGGG
jgi:hypothetical protein